MKKKVFILLTLIIMIFVTIYSQIDAGKSNHKYKLVENEQTDNTVLDFYRQYSSFTDPGEYKYLYENLPDSLPELCSLIRSQFIHPYAELPKYSEQIPKERWNESLKYPTVKSVLEGLISYDSRGLVKDRKPGDRLVLGCRHNAILLASILKNRGIPARVRCGHVTYLIPDFHASHTICEVWNENDKRWMLVDPSTVMVDFSSEKFDFSNDAWLKLQKKEIDPNFFGFPGKYSGLVSIVGKVCTDLAFILGTEYTIYQYAPILDYAFDKDKQLSAEQIETLNKICKLMKTLDAENLSKLQEIYNNTPEIQITKSFAVNPTKKEVNDVDISILEFYRQYSEYTDPGEYAYLYENLPDSLPELCRLIRSQYINYGWELDNYRELIPKERWNESLKYRTVKSALEGLLSYDSRGLVKDRKPENRLMLICRDNALLLASILKYRGIPAMVRYGFAPYLIPGFHAHHVICEVWNEKENRWMLVDPSADRIDFNREEFDFSNDVWLKIQKKEINPKLYGMPGQNEYNGSPLMTAVICFDLASILGTEYPIGQYSPILDYVFQNNQFSKKQVEILNKISELMKSIDADNISKLQEIYNNTSQIQFTKKFEPVIINTENNTRAKDSSINKPNIEFVDIPAGTFTMGSPNDEKERQDDEVQYEVTLSAFKMSKHCVTYDQFDAFCESTGRKKPWGLERGNMPIVQITWYDANEFAEWMGCRLPTEAEFEYAARANTTTAFYTGDCITTDQANFNGKKPYINCEKGEFRNKALPIGSFSPNAFGLYNMHGNIWEWTNDWYGEYDINDKLNPKGPETGTKKVDRGGGFYDPAWRCRSAYRGGGTPPGNRGPGISFRLVKDE